MQYQSTRNSGMKVSATQAIAQGISSEGGLFVPERFPQYSYSDLCGLQQLSYVERACRILADFLPEFTQEELSACVHAAYDGKFSGGEPAPLVLLQNGEINMYLLELWHGPTCAFKDMALQLLPHLLTRSLQKLGQDKTAVILVATSGDTGKAALEGFQNVEGTKVLVFYPENGVSPLQQRQMATQEGGNVSVCAIRGNFDDAQTGVKRLFADAKLKAELWQRGMTLSSANSINWGRLLPQIVYYFSAYCDLMKTGEMDYEGEKVNIVVPTGNFGNILAAYYAKKMGLPVHKFICASNSNNVLTDFLQTGVYDRNRPFYTTISPSMDILVSSNLERLLYDLTGNDSARVKGWMEQLAQTGRYQVEDDVLRQLKDLFYAGCCDDTETKASIASMYRTENYVCDTHTAVAVNVYHQYVRNTQDAQTPAIVVSTASPYKFPQSVLSAISDSPLPENEFAQVRALSALTGTPVPEPIEGLEKRAVRFDKVCSAREMEQAVASFTGAAGK